MKRIVICGSTRFFKEIAAAAKKIEEQGYIVDYPANEISTWESVTDDHVKYLMAKGLTLDYFQKIAKADIVFVYNKGGYVGNSVTLEIGYATTMRKPIYALEKNPEISREVLYESYSKTISNFLKIIKD